MIGRARRAPLPLLGGLLAAYFVVPVVLVVARVGPGHWNGIGDRQLWHAVVTSVLASSVATALVVVLGVPLAWVLARDRPPGWGRRVNNVVGALVQLPLALPPLVSGLLLIRIVGPYTWLGRLSGQRLTETLWGIILAQAFVAGPFLVVAARSAFATVNPELDNVAATLGHGGWSRFFRVDVGEAAPGIRAGMMLCWLRAFGEFGATVLLAYHPYSLPVYTYVQFGQTGVPATDVPVIVAIGIALVAVSVGHVHVRRRPPRPLPSPTPPALTASAAPLAFAVHVHVGRFRLSAAHAATSPRVALLGPSGAGKSLTLRAIAGVEEVARGRVRLGAEKLDGRTAAQRGVGYVPQGGGLLPHLDVWRQATFAVAADGGRAAWWLNRLGVDGLEARLPSQLSGGQAQRVALARALAADARLLLLDEPLSALDTPTRHQLRDELLRLQRQTCLTSVIVTHDPEEAAVLADEIVVLDQGRVLQAGPRRRLFDYPCSRHVARLLGVPNVFPGRTLADGRVAAANGLRLASEAPLQPGVSLLWSVPPEAVAPSPPAPTPVRARVVDVVDHGRFTETTFDLGGGVVLTSTHPAAGALIPDEVVGLRLPPVRAWAAPSVVAGENGEDALGVGQVVEDDVGAQIP